MKTLIATLGTLLLCITPAFAQQATSLDQLQVLVRPGDTIVVTNSGGQKNRRFFAGREKPSCSASTSSPS